MKLLMSCDSSPSWATSRWTRSVKRPSFGSKYSLSLSFELVVDGCLCWSRVFCSPTMNRSPSRRNRSAVSLAADVPQGEDADLEGFDRVLIAFVAFGVVRRDAAMTSRSWTMSSSCSGIGRSPSIGGVSWSYEAAV